MPVTIPSMYVRFDYYNVTLNCRQEILSDEEAQEVARLLCSKSKSDKWQPDLIPDSLSGPSSLVQDSSGPVSLNDSLGPPSLQDDPATEPIKNIEESTIKEPAMYDSTSSVDVTHDLDELTSSKMDASYSTFDSGLIGKKRRLSSSFQ